MLSFSELLAYDADEEPDGADYKIANYPLSLIQRAAGKKKHPSGVFFSLSYL